MSKIKTQGSQAFNVPNTEEGKAFIKLLRKFANYPDCSISCRGRGSRKNGGNQAYIPIRLSEWIAVYIRSAINDKRMYAHNNQLYDEIVALKNKNNQMIELQDVSLGETVFAPEVPRVAIPVVPEPSIPVGTITISVKGVNVKVIQE